MSNAKAEKLTIDNNNTTHKIALRRLAEMRLKTDPNFFKIASWPVNFLKLYHSLKLSFVLNLAKSYFTIIPRTEDHA